MTEQEFIKAAKKGGYATLPVIKTYIVTFSKTEYTDDDLISVHRLNEWRYNAEHNLRSHGLGKGCGTTKKYTIYNSHGGGSK